MNIPDLFDGKRTAEAIKIYIMNFGMMKKNEIQIFS